MTTKTLIVYGSTTGNTQMVAEKIGEILSEKNLDVTIEDAADVTAEGLCTDYDLVLFGASTWGQEEIELQEDFEELHDNFEEAGLNEKQIAVFGCGDSDYEWFCGAVDQITKKAEECGAVAIIQSLKIDGDPDDVTDEIIAWAEKVVSSL
ncbi:MAG: flavodoxin [Alphaproteobacteria bacterium]